jgi:hypothetical protein
VYSKSDVYTKNYIEQIERRRGDLGGGGARGRRRRFERGGGLSSGRITERSSPSGVNDFGSTPKVLF